MAAARWPYGVLLVFTVLPLVGHVWEPFAVFGYLVGLPFLVVGMWYSVTRQSPFRKALVAAVIMMVIGLILLSCLGLAGLTVFNQGMFAAEETLSWIGFIGLLPLPVLGLLTGIVGLIGGLFRPGVKVERVPLEPVGGID